ncbi:polysaccharide deacetylase family protein [Paenibacillus sp. YYML68]|uniref:polysaccharide deacetylase family protein n=1 Tax=Paenibacillus sp. YYML68 TaxID=2909250 RepID=UPI0024936650|nr:polysaccharide deacetylase family protein [Paenibacillus sp. YYML68]
MNRNKRHLLWFTAVSLTGVLLVMRQSDDVSLFVQHARQSAAEQSGFTLTSSFEHAALETWSRQDSAGERREQALEFYKTEAKKRDVAPIDAKVDGVWRAIPGYNGLAVDIEQSMEAAKSQAYQLPLPVKVREVLPTIGLDQLGPQPIYKGNPAKPMVALMINVAWGDEYIPSMLETLKQEEVKATFFLDGMWLSKHVPTAKLLLEEGHELGNHAYSHKNMSTLSRAQNAEEIAKTEKLLKEQVGYSNKLFAPPSGDFNSTTVEVAHEMKLRTILWTLDTVDWKHPPPQSIVRKIATRVEPGSLILMHPTDSSSQALKGMIQAIKAKNLQLGTVSDVLSSKRIGSEVESASQ